MNTQEALLEIEKVSRLYKAAEHLHKVVETVNNADSYIKELTETRDGLVSEVAILKNQIEILQAGKEVEKEEAGKLLAQAKVEAKVIKEKASKAAKEKFDKASNEIEAIMQEYNHVITSKKEEVKSLDVQKTQLTKDVAGLEVKYQSIKTELAKLLA